jgi:hypothetical protein
MKNRRNILGLVNNMPNLQALNVPWADDSWSDEDDKYYQAMINLSIDCGNIYDWYVRLQEKHISWMIFED